MEIFELIPLFLIALSLLMIIIIIVRKFSTLASLDVETIPAEKENKFKEQLVESRLNRSLLKTVSRLTWIFRFFQEKISGFFSWSKDRLNTAKKNYSNEDSASLDKDEKNDKTGVLFSQIKELDDKDNFSEMEEKLIDIIGLDSKNVRAFESLGELYCKNKKHEEAKQAFEHVLKLLKDSEVDKQAEIYSDLALVCKETGDIEEAVKNIQKAVKFSPNNPRFLDSMLEMSIIIKDKLLAEEALSRLMEANPDNNKLAEWKDKIKSLD